jgi:hypothetical protein
MRSILSALVVLFLSTQAMAHGEADWIQKGGYKNPAGELCCGERDCAKFISGTVKHVPGKYIIEAYFLLDYFEYDEFGESAGELKQRIEYYSDVVPEHEAQPSPDGQYWYCKWSGVRKCFFAPPENY